MKATLKNTTQGYVLIVDEWPSNKEFWYHYNEFTNKVSNNFNDANSDYCFRVIASETPLEGVKGIVFESNQNLYPIHLTRKEFINRYIDTEVQATEHEEYYLITL